MKMKKQTQSPHHIQLGTTNHTNNTNKVKRLFIFYVKENYIVNTFVQFVLFVVKKRIVGALCLRK